LIDQMEAWFFLNNIRSRILLTFVTYML